MLVVEVGALLKMLIMCVIEHFVAWRGQRNRLRAKLQATTNYGDWVKAAKELDTFLGNDKWKTDNEYAYYDHKTVKRVLDQIRRCRTNIENESKTNSRSPTVIINGTGQSSTSVEDLKSLIEACVKNNFVGVENSRLYSQTYFGTKTLVQDFVDEGEHISSLSLK